MTYPDSGNTLSSTSLTGGDTDAGVGAAVPGVEITLCPLSVPHADISINVQTHSAKHSSLLKHLRLTASPALSCFVLIAFKSMSFACHKYSILPG